MIHRPETKEVATMSITAKIQSDMIEAMKMCIRDSVGGVRGVDVPQLLVGGVGVGLRDRCVGGKGMDGRQKGE